MQIYTEKLYINIKNEELCELIDNIDYIYMHDLQDNTLIQEVISRSNIYAMSALLKRNDLEVNDLIPKIVEYDDSEMMLTLLSKKDLDVNDLLCEVVKSGSVCMMRALLVGENLDIDIDYVPSMIVAIELGHAEMFKLLFRDGINDDTSVDEIAQFSQQMLVINSSHKGDQSLQEGNAQIENFLIAQGALDCVGDCAEPTVF